MTSSAEAWKFRLGADIWASDGTAGKLVAVAVVADEQGQTLTYLGIRVRLFSRHHYFVPVEVVTGADAERVTLNIALAEIEKWSWMPSDSGIVLSSSTRMNTIDARDARERGDVAGKQLGRLVQITVDPVTHALRSLVVDRGWRGEVLVPARAVTSVAAQQVTARLGISPDRLLPYRPDEQLRQDIYDQLFDHAPLRLDLAAIEIRPLDGVVQCEGTSLMTFCGAWPRIRSRASQECRSYTTTSWQTMTLPRGSRWPSRSTRERPGNTSASTHASARYVCAEVSDARRLRGASKVARAVPAMTRIMNELRIDPEANEIPVLAGITNCEDMVPGSR